MKTDMQKISELSRPGGIIERTGKIVRPNVCYALQPCGTWIS